MEKPEEHDDIRGMLVNELHLWNEMRRAVNNILFELQFRTAESGYTTDVDAIRDVIALHGDLIRYDQIIMRYENRIYENRITGMKRKGEE